MGTNPVTMRAHRLCTIAVVDMDQAEAILATIDRLTVGLPNGRDEIRRGLEDMVGVLSRNGLDSVEIVLFLNTAAPAFANLIHGRVHRGG